MIELHPRCRKPIQLRRLVIRCPISPQRLITKIEAVEVADEKDVEITLAYLEPVTIFGDAHRLKQMVWILIHNAIKFTPGGGEIKITLQDMDDTVYFTIKDTGIGIPEQDLPKIFDRFYRVDKARSRQEGGSGLGLAICKYIVDRHQGTIDVESKLGEGTKFKIRFPKHQVAERKIA